MSDSNKLLDVVFPREDKPSRIVKWKVSPGTVVTAGRILLVYADAATGKSEKKFKAAQFGKVVEILVKNNEVVHPGQKILVLEGCKHLTVIKDLCADCGADLREEFIANPDKSSLAQANVPMVHSVPELKVTAELAEKIGREDKERLLKHQQLVLLVDLDQTIVHTTNDNIPADMQDVYHFQLYGPNSPWYHTRLRPHTRNFLTEVSKYYELHICTFGARQYAHKVASLLDSDGKLFSHRILSRDECFDPQSKTANLKALFPCGVDMVCIIDDRDDVWQGCANLVQVKPYHFFLHTGDINVPPGLGKHDDPCPPKSMTEEALREDQTPCENIENGEDLENKEKIGIDSEEAEEPEVRKNENSKKDKNSKEKLKDIDENSQEKSEKGEGEEKSTNDTENSGEKQKSGKSRKRWKEKEKVEEPQPVQEFGPDMEDQDDYLLYLEDILKRIHTEFYTETDKSVRMKTLREIIPRVRSRVLEGLNLTFSGLVPNNQKLHQSRAYKVAKAFGAEVTQELNDKSTHLVAIQPGTVKVRDAKRNRDGKVKIVNPDWLWTCAERWERVDERLYPLKEVPLHKAREFRKPPAHCSTPEYVPNIEEDFASSINPLSKFSKEEIAIMAQEIDEDIPDLGSASDEDNIIPPEDNDSDSNEVYGYEKDSDDEFQGAKRRKLDDNESNSEGSSVVDDEEDPVTRFRRGEDLPNDVELGDESQDSVGYLDNDDLEDDVEWNAMGAALEREFLSE